MGQEHREQLREGMRQGMALRISPGQKAVQAGQCERESVTEGLTSYGDVQVSLMGHL